MKRQITRILKRALFLSAWVGALVLASCSMPGTAPVSGPDAYNTNVAQTALARGAIPPAVTAAPSAIPTATATPGTPILISANVSLPRHSALDFETKTVSAPLADMNLINQNIPDLSKYYEKAPADSDLVFWAENPTAPDWQFLYPVHGTRMVFPTPKPFTEPNAEGCIQAFGGAGVLVPEDNQAFTLDFSVFVTHPGTYHCFITDKGNLGTFKLTAPGDYIGMPHVIIDYVVWDARLP